MAECQALERKNQKQPKSDLLVKQVFTNVRTNQLNDHVAKSTLLSYLQDQLGQPDDTPITILRDTGATQRLLLENVLPFSEKSFTGDSVLIQGIGLGTMQVPLHQVQLSSDIVSGPIVVGLRPSLPVRGVSLILGNDVAGCRVEVNLCVSDSPYSDVADPLEDIPGLFPACAVTRAMNQKETQKTSEEHTPDEPTPLEC